MESTTIYGALVIVGVVISAIASFQLNQVQNKQQLKFEQELREKSEENSRLNRKIAELNEELVKNVLGGDSFCYLTFSIGDLSGDPFVILISEGKYPLYDVSIDMVDLDLLNQLKKQGDKLAIFNARKNIEVGNVSPGFGRRFGNYSLTNLKQKNFNVFIYARNGSWNQAIRLRKVANKWVMATNVSKEGKEIFKKVDPDYPLENGEVNWNVGDK